MGSGHETEAVDDQCDHDAEREGDEAQPGVVQFPPPHRQSRRHQGSGSEEHQHRCPHDLRDETSNELGSHLEITPSAPAGAATVLTARRSAQDAIMDRCRKPQATISASGSAAVLLTGIRLRIDWGTRSALVRGYDRFGSSPEQKLEPNAP